MSILLGSCCRRTGPGPSGSRPCPRRALEAVQPADGLRQQMSVSRAPRLRSRDWPSVEPPDLQPELVDEVQAHEGAAGAVLGTVAQGDDGLDHGLEGLEL